MKHREFLPLCTAVGESCLELAKQRNPFNLDHRLNQSKPCEGRYTGDAPHPSIPHCSQTTSKGLKEMGRATSKRCTERELKHTHIPPTAGLTPQQCMGLWGGTSRGWGMKSAGSGEKGPVTPHRHPDSPGHRSTRTSLGLFARKGSGTGRVGGCSH